MNDLFYLSPQKLDTRRVCQLFQSYPDVRAEGFPTSQAVQLFAWGRMFHLALMEPSEFQDPEDRALLEARGVSTVVCVSHHKSEALAVLLRLLLEAWGGWVGQDAPGFEPLLSLEDLPASPSGQEC